MSNLKNFGVTVLLGTILLAGQAVAADAVVDDVLDAEMEIDAPELADIQTVNGWYVRGDLGYNAAVGGDTSYRTFDGSAYTSHRGAGDFSKDVSLNFGVGYTFTDMIRGDVTMGRISAAFEGRGACDPSVGQDCERTAVADFVGYSVLANAYVDLGTIVGLTPYVGAGAGYTYLKWDDIVTNDGSGAVLHPGESGWRLSYALMAGVAYDISRSLKLDVGYRYMNIDGDGMYGWDAPSASGGATGLQGEHDNIATHEIRVGLRVVF